MLNIPLTEEEMNDLGRTDYPTFPPTDENLVDFGREQQK